MNTLDTDFSRLISIERHIYGQLVTGFYMFISIGQHIYGQLVTGFHKFICIGQHIYGQLAIDLDEEHGKEGEVWISSPSAGVGYWSQHELSQKTFGNVLSNCPGKKFTRTGDLGRILDGKLFITGRIKDLIIVAGRNIYSADVEKTVENSCELLRPGCCAVIGVPEEILASKGILLPDSSDQVGLVVIAEVREGKPADKEIVNQIQTRVAEEHGVSVASVKPVKRRLGR